MTERNVVPSGAWSGCGAHKGYRRWRPLATEGLGPGLPSGTTGSFVASAWKEGNMNRGVIGTIIGVLVIIILVIVILQMT